MGKGYFYKCKKCKKEYLAELGIGMSFPNVYREVMADVKSGKYGDEFSNIANSREYVVVDAGCEVYICEHCDKWYSEYVLNLYEPKNTDRISKKLYGNKTVEELGYIPFVIPHILRANYRLLKRYVHHCPDCGKITHKASKKEILTLPCPYCKAKNNETGELFWD